MTTDRWTHADETKLNAMLKRKNEIMSKNKAPVVEIASKIVEWVNNAHIELPDKLIENSNLIRDALEPFDDRGYLRT